MKVDLFGANMKRFMYKMRNGKVEFYNGISWTRKITGIKLYEDNKENGLFLKKLFKKLEVNNPSISNAMCGDACNIDMGWFYR